MKLAKTILPITVAALITACAATEAPDNTAIVFNKRGDGTATVQFTHALCFKKRPVMQWEKKRYIGTGQQTFWVRAATVPLRERHREKNPLINNPSRVAYLGFNLNTSEGQQLFLQSEFKADQVYVWLTNNEGKAVTKVQSSRLMLAGESTSRFAAKQCKRS